jgi:hypothetical protein
VRRQHVIVWHLNLCSSIARESANPHAGLSRS